MHSDIKKTGQDNSRRRFLREISAVPILTALGGISLPGSDSDLPQASTARRAPRFRDKRFVAIQLGARSFMDEGVQNILPWLQEHAGVNVLMPTVFTYGRGLAGRQVPGEPLPDHGVQAYDEVLGGSYTALHSEFASKSPIRNVRAPELGDFDVLAAVIPAAKARGMETYALFEEAYNPRRMDGFEQIAEVGLDGGLGPSTCLNNRHARDFLAALVEDWFRHNHLDGMMWESERQGPLYNALGLHFGRFDGNSPVYCFCRYCEAKASAQRIDVQRARAGYTALLQWVRQTRSGRGSDATGNFITLWRLLTEYPEIIAWHRQWFHGQEEVYALLYRAVKQINPTAQVGWHIMHLVTMSPFYQADQNYARIAQAADFIKPCTYNNCAGPRFAQFVRNVQTTVWSDLSPDEVLALHYRLLHYAGEPSLEDLPARGMSAQYVARETRRALAEVQGAVPIYPGIDIDIPTALNEKRTQPSDVKAAVLAAFRAGAPGVVLSRKYAEMRLANLAAAGDALRESG